MRPSKCVRITSLKVHFYRQHRRLLSSRYALFDGRLSNWVIETFPITYRGRTLRRGIVDALSSCYRNEIGRCYIICDEENFALLNELEKLEGAEK